MLNEKELRRADFLEGQSVPVVLADGQEWFVPKPMIYVMPSDSAIGYEHIVESGDSEFDDSFGKAWALFQSALEDDGDPNAYMKGMMTVFRAMLERNYRLEISDLRQILKFRPIGEDAIRDSLMAIARGLESPKVLSVGDF